jgi:hypothetical protein
VLEPIIARQQQSILNPGSRLLRLRRCTLKRHQQGSDTTTRVHDHQRKQQPVDINPILIGIKNTT